MRLIPRWNRIQWLGSSLMLVASLGLAFMSLPRSHAIAPVPLSQLGLAEDHAEKSLVVASTMPKFRLVGAAAGEDVSKKSAQLWDAMLKVRGSFPDNVPQQIGDCVSWGAANAINYLQAVQLAKDQSGDELHLAYPPWIYGTSRVNVGKKHGSNFRGDGSVGAYAAEALNTYGCLRSDHAQVPPYSGAIAKLWGSQGPPQWAFDIAKPYLVQTVAQVTNAEDAWSSVYNGFPVTIASGWWGTTSIPIVDGIRVATRTTAWGHQQCVIGTKIVGKNRYFYVLNSWGPNAHPMGTGGEPPGGYWIRFADMDHICSEGDSWALSSFEGFPAEGINWDELTRRPITSSAAPNQGQGGEQNMTLPVESLYVIALFLMGIIGFLCFRWATKTSGRVMVAFGLLFATGSNLPAQDFEAAARRDLPSTIQTPGTEMHDAFNEASGASATHWNDAATRQQNVVESISWATAAIRREVVSLAAVPKARALVFFRQVGCSDCTKEVAHVKRDVAIPKRGWTMGTGASADADFRLVDVLDPKNSEIVRLHNVERVPTTLYLSKYGEVKERFEGFSSTRSLTAPLTKLASSP